MPGQIKINRQDAFVLIDGQNDFIKEDGALYVAGVEGELPNDEIIERINRLRREQVAFGHCVVTLDKHPVEGHIEYDIFGRHCVRDTKGQLLDDRFEVVYIFADEILLKGMHPALISYSVAASPDFPNHIETLRGKGIKRIFLVGWAFTHCVGESAIAYAVQSFEVYVVRDLCRSVPPPHGNPKLMEKKLKLYRVKLINSNQIR